MEECAEVAQRLSKAKRFGMEEVQADDHANPDRLNNCERVWGEYVHLCAVMEMAGFSLRAVLLRDLAALEKQRKVEKYLEYSKTCGTLDE